MAKKVTGQAVGGEAQTFDDVRTVGELKQRMDLPNYQASVNGNPVNNDYALPNYAYVSLSAPVKGGK